jgi:hypothetical protein
VLPIASSFSTCDGRCDPVFFRNATSILLNDGGAGRRIPLSCSGIAAVFPHLTLQPGDSADEPRSVSMTTDETKTKVTILTGTYRVKGYIDLLPGARVTDYLVESKDFIAVTDAEVWELGNRHVLNASFLNVSRDHIQIVTPGG